MKEVKLKNGEVLFIRKPTIEDAENMIKYLNNIGGESDNLLFSKDDFHLSIEQEKEYIKNLTNNTNSIMLLGLINNEIISVSGLVTSSRKRIAHNSEFSISVKKAYWGLGVGNAIMDATINFAQSTKMIKNISLGVKSDNVNAIKLYEKHGFVKIGVHKNFFNIDGIYYDEILMDLNL